MNKAPRAAALLALGLGLAITPARADDRGATVFSEICAACHGAAGVGIGGVAPPLVDPPLWTGLGDKAPAYFAGVVANGLSGRISVQGQDYIGLVMPSQADLPDADLVAVGDYVLRTLNGLAQGPDAAAIAAAKATPSTHKALRALRAESGL